jgi:ketosteroid isomerase-like protein
MTAEQEQAGDEAAIRALLAERAAAFRARDASRFVASLDPSIVIFDLAPPLRRGGPELLDPRGCRPGWTPGMARAGTRWRS